MRKIIIKANTLLIEIIEDKPSKKFIIRKDIVATLDKSIFIEGNLYFIIYVRSENGLRKFAISSMDITI